MFGLKVALTGLWESDCQGLVSYSHYSMTSYSTDRKFYDIMSNFGVNIVSPMEQPHLKPQY